MSKRVRTGRMVAAATAGALAAAWIAAGSTPAGAADPASGLVDSTRHWAPVAAATLHPGVVTLTADSECTANFVFTAAGRTFLGQAAHCSGTGADTDTNGCTGQSLPLGTPVQFVGTGVTGRMAYNSWLQMQHTGGADPEACAYNDLALVEIPAAEVGKVNPSLPVYGGPNGLNTDGTRTGDRVESYGNSGLRRGIAALSPKSGASVGDDGHGWSHCVYTVTPGIPGDSGSAVLDSQGRALGDLSTLALAPTPLSNQVSDLDHELAYARVHSDLKDLRLAAGTAPFQARPMTG